MANRFRFFVGMTTKDGGEVTREMLRDLGAAVSLFGGGGFTRFDALGNWEGVDEDSRVFEVISSPRLAHLQSEEAAKRLAWNLARIARQNCVLVTIDRVIAHLVDGDEEKNA